VPREIVHWEILEAARTQLNDQPALSTILHEFRAASYLGAMGPDAPYYHNLGRGAFEKLAEELHGADGEDTFAPARSLGRRIVSLDGPEAGFSWAFLAGYLSHCAVDIVFHPVIYHLTGDYYHPDADLRRAARARHRAFEVHLDSWWEKHAGALLTSSIRQVLAQSVPGTRVLWPLLDDALPANGEGNWKNAYRDLSILQQLFFSPAAGILAKALKILSGNKLAGEEALFRLGRDKPLAYFDNTVSFRNPVTGVEERSDMAHLRRKALDLTVSFIKELSPWIEGTKSVTEEIFFGQHGASLNSGIVGATKAQMKFFADRPPEFLG
jgi:hypothetical protein